MQLFIIAGIAVSCLFIAFILSKKNRKRADVLLVLINLLLITFLALDVIVREKITINLFFAQAQLPFYLYPVFFLFAAETVQSKLKISWLFFVPSIANTIGIGADLYFLHDYHSKELLDGVYNDPPFFYHILYKGNQVFFIAALVWLIRKLKVYEREIRDNFSFTDPIDLSWLTHFSWIFLAITVISLTTFLISNFQFLPVDVHTAYSIVSACKVLAIFYLSYHGIRQYSIAEYYGKQSAALITEPISATGTETQDSKEKYRTSSLSREEQETIHKRLLELFDVQAVYLESKLQLLDVADKLNVGPHVLSQTINTMTGKPFYDFVNGYRVRNLQRLLEDPSKKRFTILALGLDSGFNSKASLNRVFKDMVGVSPSEYQKNTIRN